MGTLWLNTVNLQELVEEREDNTENGAHDPEAEGQGGQGRVIFGGDGGGNLGDGRVFFFLKDDRRPFDITLEVVDFVSLFGIVFLRHGGGGGDGGRERECVYVCACRSRRTKIKTKVEGKGFYSSSEKLCLA